MQKWISSGRFPEVLKGFHSHEMIDFSQDNRPGGEAGRDARQEEGAAGLCCGVCHRRQSSRQEDLWPMVPSRQVSHSTFCFWKHSTKNISTQWSVIPWRVPPPTSPWCRRHHWRTSSQVTSKTTFDLDGNFFQTKRRQRGGVGEAVGAVPQPHLPTCRVLSKERTAPQVHISNHSSTGHKCIDAKISNNNLNNFFSRVDASQSANSVFAEIQKIFKAADFNNNKSQAKL